MSEHSFGDAALAVRVTARGAELASLRDAAGREYLWQAGPAWPRHAPLLFPVVGKLPGDVLRHAGRAYPLKQHGFARESVFAWLERGERGCRLLLRDDATTRASYPFGFRLEVAYAVAEGALSITATVTNPGAEVLPFSLGFHPGFAWPLPGAMGKAGHLLRFDAAEPAPAARMPGGVLQPDAEPSPLHGRELPLDEALFAADALVLPAVNSRGLDYLGPDGGGLRIGWRNTPQLGLWMKPGAAFICVEPWHGHPCPVGWDAEFSTKPGILLLPPGEGAELGLSLSPIPAAR